MIGKMGKKAVAGLMALLLVSEGVSVQPFPQVLDKASVTANAANGSVTLDEKTGTLTFSGNITLEDVRQYAGSKKRVESVVALEGTVLPRSCAEMFKRFVYAKSIDLSKADTSNVTDMSHMFDGCDRLTNLDLSNFDTSNVTDMSHMFEGCYDLTNLYNISFDTSNVTRMDYMFRLCVKLPSLDLSNFDTSNVTRMEYMFEGDLRLTTIYVSEKWNTSKVSYSSEMFAYCDALVGGTGTAYRSDITDDTYAVIDDRENGQYGYFTDINLKKPESTITTTDINVTDTTTTSVTTTTNTPVTIKYGDVNGDTIVDAVDASLVLRQYALSSTSDESNFTKEQETAANVNMDNYVDSNDASLILKYYAYSSITDKPVSIEDYLNINKKITNTTSTAKITTTTTNAKLTSYNY